MLYQYSDPAFLTPFWRLATLGGSFGSFPRIRPHALWTKQQMPTIRTRATQHVLSPTSHFALVLLAVVFLCPRVASAVLPLGDEHDAWSDMLLPSASGFFDTLNTRTLTIFTDTVAGELEIGSQFGPSNPGSHYGAAGTLGGIFNVSFSISRLHITASGAVADAESIIILQYQGGSAGSLGTDYGINTGRSLLRGKALEVLLDAAGDNLSTSFSPPAATCSNSRTNRRRCSASSRPATSAWCALLLPTCPATGRATSTSPPHPFTSSAFLNPAPAS